MTMIFPLLSLFHTAPASGPSPDLADSRVEPVATTLQRLMPELSTPVRVAPKLADELVFVARNGVSAEATLAAIADALHASITTRREGRLLERTPADLREFERARTAQRAGWISKRMDGVKAYRASRLSGRPASEAILTEVERTARTRDEVARGKRKLLDPFFATELLPGETLLLALIEKIGRAKLATVPYGAAQVWEDAPVAGALPLPSCEKELAAYEAEIAPLRGTPLSNESQSQMGRLSGMKPFFADWMADSQPPTRLRLNVRTDTMGVLIGLEGYDARGKLQLKSGMSARPVPVFRSHPVILQESLDKPNGRWIALSPESKKATAWRADYELSQLPDWFRDPEANEPLNLIVREALVGLAREVPDRCFVAHASDSLWDAANSSVSEGRMNLDAFEAVLGEIMMYERRQTEASVVLCPQASLNPSDLRTNRRALKELVRDVLRTKRMDLRTSARFAVRIGASPSYFAVLWGTRLRYTKGVLTPQGGAPHHLLRMLGSLSEATWRRLEAGDTASVGELRVESAYGDLLDEGYLGLESRDPIPDIYRHPRELYPDGAIGSARIALVPRRTELVGWQSPLGDGSIVWGYVPDLPGHVWKSRDEYERWLGNYKFQQGTQSDLRIILSLPRGITHTSAVTEPIVPTTELGLYEKLPREIRDAAWNRKSAIEPSLPGGKSVEGEQPTRRVPPP